MTSSRHLATTLSPFAAAALAVGCVPASSDDDDDSAAGVVEGYAVGDVAPDFTLPDQAGEDVALSDFEGMKVLLDFSALWCNPCKEASAAAETVQADLAAEFPFQYLVVIAQDSFGNPPTVEHATEWADDFDLTLPVLADTAWAVSPGYLEANDATALPQFFVIDTEGVIRAIHVGYGTGDEQAVMQAVRDA